MASSSLMTVVSHTRKSRKPPSLTASTWSKRKTAQGPPCRFRACTTTCRWQDAIAALEHAFTCYIKIYGDIDAIRGAIDAGRRLSRVYLRAGPSVASRTAESTSYLDEATEWLARAWEIKKRRSDVIVNDRHSRFRLHDVLLDAQLEQVWTQIELTRQLLIWDNLDEDDDLSPEVLSQFVSEPYRYPNGSMSRYSRLDEAHQALSLLQRIKGLRLVPEFRMHIIRLCALAQDPSALKHIENLEAWFERDGLRHQADLLAVQDWCLRHRDSH